MLLLIICLLLIIYKCKILKNNYNAIFILLSTSQDKTDFKEEDEKPLYMNNYLDEPVEDENQQSVNLEIGEQRPIIEEIEDTEKESGTEEIIESDKVGKTLNYLFHRES